MILREQIETLTKLMSNESGQNRRWHIPSPHESEEEDVRVKDEDGNPFAECRVHRHQPLVQGQANRWESNLKLNIPEFNGDLQSKEFLDWIAVVEEVLEFKVVPEDKQVSLVATKFWGRVAAIEAIKDSAGQIKSQQMGETVKTHAAGLLAIQLYPNHIPTAAEFKLRFEDHG